MPCKCSGKYIDIYFNLKITYFKNTKNLFIHIARIPIGDSPRIHPNILKMSPPFASSEGVSASGVRYQSDGV